MPDEYLTDYLRELRRWTPLTRSEKNKIEKFFDEKIVYLVECGDLEQSLAGPLKYLHRYRNEAYHRAKVRSETIRTAALILLEINCELVIGMQTDTYSSGEDYSWFETRFGAKPQHVFLSLDSLLPKIVEDIRSRVLPTDASVSETLASHLRQRFSELDEDLALIVETCREQITKDGALRQAEFYAELERTGATAHYSVEASKGFSPKYSSRYIQELEAQLANVSSAATRVEAFGQFSAIEKGLEPIEEPVAKMVVAIEQSIQADVDIARGK